jgi:hypothetical protein
VPLRSFRHSLWCPSFKCPFFSNETRRLHRTVGTSQSIASTNHVRLVPLRCLLKIVQLSPARVDLPLLRTVAGESVTLMLMETEMAILGYCILDILVTRYSRVLAKHCSGLDHKRAPSSRGVACCLVPITKGSGCAPRYSQDLTPIAYASYVHKVLLFLKTPFHRTETFADTES